MKTNTKRFLSILMALVMLLALGTSAFAAGDEHPTGLDVPEVHVYFPNYMIELSAGQSTSVKATVQGADSKAKYEWHSDDTSVATVKGNKETVTVTAVGSGQAAITLTVTRGDGLSSDFDFFYVKVEGSASPISVSGGGTVKMEEGDTRQLSATVSGGSGSYTYEWEAYGNAALAVVDQLRMQAEIYAGRSGSGTVLLTVYDAEDPSNNDTVVWEFTVSSQKQTTAPEVQLSRGSMEIGLGGSASLQASVTGGSGKYEYYWDCDTPRLVSLDTHGALADIYAADTLLLGSNTAEVSLYVRDLETGLFSNTAVCVVKVTGGSSSSFNSRETVNAGNYFDMDSIASDIAAFFRMDIGSSLRRSASVKFSSASSKAGSLRMQDGTAVRSGTNYTFGTFEDMYFRADIAGTFSTDYMIVDGGNTISGTITFEVVGSRATVKTATLDPSYIRMPTYSNDFLTLSVSPSNAGYSVSWESSSSVVTVTGSGSKVTLRSNGRTGTATITATIIDAGSNVIVRTCDVTVYDDSAANYNPSITIMLGSDYYGSKLSDSMANKFKSEFGVYPGDTATISFSSLGKSTYGTLRLKNGTAAVANRDYTFRDWIDMYFTPNAKGTYSLGYTLTYRGNTLHGTIDVIIEAASLNVTMNPTALQMSPYSTQYITLDIAPATAYYWVEWASSDATVAAVSGSNTTAVVTSVGPGTATVYAVVTDVYGVQIRKACAVVVSSIDTVFNPSVATTLGIPYTGTGTSEAMTKQFAALYNTTLDKSATIRFSSVGNNDVGVLRLADGSAIKPNVNYTLEQYIAMYTQPVSAGTFSIPYELLYAGKKLNGTVSVVISPASISTDLALAANAPFGFSDAIDGSTGAALFADSITNAVGANWGYVRFSASANDVGTLYADRNSTAIKTDANYTLDLLSQLYFVPGSLNGVFSVPYTVHTSAGTVLANGTLNISRPGSKFTDVADDAYYAPAVTWAVSRSITSGTSETTFSPEMTVTRAQAVAFLWNAAGRPANKIESNPFTDVPAGTWYTDAVLWAVQQGLTNGTSDTTFSPELTLSRDQLLALLFRANGGGLGGANWSQLAVDWANGRGLLDGVPGTFDAKSACPRCDVVYYLWKYYNG